MKRNRWKWLVGLALLSFFYVPLNQLMWLKNQGIEVVVDWDKLIPVWPIWVVPYSLVVPFWYVSGWLLGRKLTGIEFKRYVFSMVLAMVVGFSFFVFMPTYVVRPEVDGGGIVNEWLRWVHRNDGDQNAYPSSHVYLTVVTCFYWWRLVRKKWWWILITVVVSVSTVVTGQHHVLDPIAGLVVGVVACWVGVRAVCEGKKFGLWSVRGL